MEPFIAVEPDMALAIRLAAGRSSMSDAEFAQLLQTLIEACRRQGYKAGNSVRVELHPYVPPVIVPLRSDTPIPGAPPARPLGPVPHIVPMRTKEDALAAHRTAHPELYDEEGKRKREPLLSKEITEEDLDALERATRPDPPPRSLDSRGRATRKVDDAGRADIQKRAKQARTDGLGRYPKGFIRRLAEEYQVSDALIYNIIYSDPNYEAVPKA